MERIMALLKSPNMWISVIVLVAVVITVKIVTKLEQNMFAKHDFPGKSATQIRIMAGTIRYGLLGFALLTVLQINGINVSSIVAGLGVAGIIVGFALQDILKDVIMGLNIITKSFLNIGDVIRYEDENWMVEDVSIRFLQLKNVDSAEIFTVSNRNISEIRRVAPYQDMIIPGDYGVPASRMRAVCEAVCEKVKSFPEVRECKFLGTDQFDESQISYKIRVYSPPASRGPVRRLVNGVIQDILEENSLEIPFNQLDVHLKK